MKWLSELRPSCQRTMKSPTRACIWLSAISLSVNTVSSVNRFKLTKTKPKMLVHNGDLLRSRFGGGAGGGDSEHRNKSISKNQDGSLVLAALLWKCRVVVNVASRCSRKVWIKVPVIFSSRCSPHLSHPQRADLHCSLKESKEPSHS